MTNPGGKTPPLLRDKHYRTPSAFTPESLLREARPQKGAELASDPPVCLLDPDGDIERQLRALGTATRHDGWVCYHTDLWVFELARTRIGAVGCAVGASFAVLIAEELFASGCELLISVTSSGQIVPVGEPPYLILIDWALRDEGTSDHYCETRPVQRATSKISRAPGARLLWSQSIRGLSSTA